MKFNPKHYQGKQRVFTRIPKSPNISRLWIWNEETKEYQPPQYGKAYAARKYFIGNDGNRVRSSQTFFTTLDEARAWQVSNVPTVPLSTIQNLEETPVKISGPTLGEVIEKWRKKKFPTLQETTRIAYEKIIRLYLGSLMNLSIHEITPSRVDQWLDELKNPVGFAMQSSRRLAFRHELGVLSSALRYYDEYHSDSGFLFPIKKRHWKDARTERKRILKSKDLTQEEFLRFRAELEKTKYGHVLAPLATIQYFQALRISEAVALHFEDIRLDRTSPKNSRILIQRSAFFPRVKGKATSIKDGFKNSKKFLGGIKEQPIFPEAYEVLSNYLVERTRGLLFSIKEKPIEYRTIQHYYDLAFKRAGLPYRGTHVLRHGWTMELFNKTTDLTVAKELLGDTSDDAARVYAVRRAGSLTRVSDSIWEHYEVGCNWLQSKKEK